MHSLKKEGHRDLYFNQAEGRAIKKKRVFLPNANPFPKRPSKDDVTWSRRVVVVQLCCRFKASALAKYSLEPVFKRENIYIYIHAVMSLEMKWLDVAAAASRNSQEEEEKKRSKFDN